MNGGPWCASVAGLGGLESPVLRYRPPDTLDPFRRFRPSAHSAVVLAPREPIAPGARHRGLTGSAPELAPDRHGAFGQCRHSAPGLFGRCAKTLRARDGEQ
jgi:hypothetical protein